MTSLDPPPAYSPSQQPQVAIQQSVVTVQSDLTQQGSPKTRGPWKGLRVTGYLQVILGVFSVLFGLLAIVFKAYMYVAGSPIWAAILFYIVAGILGIAAGRRKRKDLVVAYLTMSILAAVVASGIVIAYGMAVHFDGLACPDQFNLPYDFEYRVGCSSSFESRAAINGMILAVGVVEMIVAIVGASMTCSDLCCRPPPRPVVYYQSAPHVVVAGQPPGVVQPAVMPQQQFVQQPQFGSVTYPGQQVMVAPMPPHYEAQAPPTDEKLPPSQMV